MALKITCKVCGVKVVKLDDGTFVHDEPPPVEIPSHRAQAIAELIKGGSLNHG